MLFLLYFAVSLFASTIGGICGVGGGVIIRPVLDATGTMSVNMISFLSGCTVLCMSVVSVFKNRKNKGQIELRTATALAIGAIAGGVLGKQLFDVISVAANDNNFLGAIQAAILIVITVATLFYSIFNDRIKTKQFNNVFVCIGVGLVLGTISSFLGIGGGPINLMVLSYFFSMGMKKAAANSLYIIMLSQLASLTQTIANQTVPSFDPFVLLLMASGGIGGALIGSKINKKISDEVVGTLYKACILIIIGISCYNFVRYAFL